MMITVNIFWIVLLIVVVHTILQHFISWGWRTVKTDNDWDMTGLIVATFLEFIALIVSLILILP